jgi:oligopeptide transport system permease protein
MTTTVNTTASATTTSTPPKGRSLWSDAGRRFRGNKLAVASVFVLAFIVILAAIAPLLTPWPYDMILNNEALFNSEYEAFNDANFPRAPDFVNSLWFGSGVNDRDLFYRSMIGVLISLAVGLTASLVALLIGVIYGSVSGYFGGRVDQIMMRIVDIIYALPFMFIVILLMVMFGRNFFLMFAAIGAVEWLTMARIVRGQTLSLKSREFVSAARASGVSSFNIIRRHIIPNLLGPVIVYVTLVVPQVILVESFLSFLGLGVQEPMTSLGVLISEGAKRLEDAPHTLLFPASILAIILFCLNFIGDGLRDALDPKDR